MRQGIGSLIFMGCAALAACGGGGESAPIPVPIASTPPTPPPVPVPTPPPPPVAPSTDIDTKSEASDFLRRAGFGGTDATIDALTGGSAVAWVSAQLKKPPHEFRSDLGGRLNEDDTKFPQVSQLLYETMIETDAELRARMTYALSQIFVINGDETFNEGRGLAVYVDHLDRNAFGNYRDLMGDITRSPIMGDYLTYLYNRKADPEKGRAPDENYARELLQLFTIGLVELKPDGTPKLGADGQPVETYTNEDIVGLAKVFTGYKLAGTSHRWQDRFDDTWERPMMMHEDDHSSQEKRFLGSVIAADTQGEASIDQALDIIFAHPNVGPFVSRQLIQRFTASDPAPDYVKRVAAAFDSGTFTADDETKFGTGARGDLAATLAAILLDPSLHDDKSLTREGKVREPVLNFVHFARAYNEASVNLVKSGWSVFADTSDVTERLGQSPLKSPSVFNFYRPGFVAPGTKTGDAGLTAPELQIVNEASAIGYINFMYDLISRTDGEYTVVPNYEDELALASDPAALVDRIDLTLTGGEMTKATRQAIIGALDALPVRESNADTDRRSRVRIAMMMTVVSPEYMTLN